MTRALLMLVLTAAFCSEGDAQNAKKAEFDAMAVRLEKLQASYRKMASDLDGDRKRTCPRQETPDQCDRDYREATALTSEIGDTISAAARSWRELASKGSTSSVDFNGWKDKGPSEILKAKILALEKYRSQAPATGSGDENLVVFENSCAQMLATAAAPNIELARGTATFEIRTDQRQKVETDVRERSGRLIADENPSWEQLKANLAAIDEHAPMPTAEFEAFAKKHGITCSTTRCDAAPKDMKAFLRDGQALQALLLMRWKLQYRFVLKSAPAAAAKEFGNLYAGDVSSDAGIADRYQRIRSETLSAMDDLSALSYSAVTLPRNKNNLYRRYEAADFFKAVELAMKIEAGAKAMTELAKRGNLQQGMFTCRIDPRVAE